MHHSLFDRSIRNSKMFDCFKLSLRITVLVFTIKLYTERLTQTNYLQNITTITLNFN